MSALLEPPVKPQEGPALTSGVTQWSSPCGFAEATLDTVSFDFHLDIAPDSPPSIVRLAHDRLRRLGFEPIPEDECPAELLDNGRVRIYLVPSEPVDDSPLIPAQPGEAL